MKNKKKVLAVMLLAVAVLMIVLPGCNLSESTLQTLYEQTGDRLIEKGTPTVGSLGGEWVVIGLAQSGRLSKKMAEEYLENAVAYVEDIGSERLHAVKSTENSRVILGITAAGGNPADIAGYDLLAGLADMEYIKGQGNNGPIWALIAYDCGDYEIPKNEKAQNQVTREKLVEYILSMQCSDGGWGLAGDDSDVDMTAMALQSLAPYKEEETVKAAVEKALTFLADSQKEDGGYESYGTKNSESCSQVIVALTALELDPMTAQRFVKEGNSVMDALCSFAVEDGFCHQTAMPVADAMATEQAYYALTAYYRFKEGKTSLYSGLLK